MNTHPPSYQVVKTVAQKEGVSPTQLSPPLFNAIDPEALDAVFQASSNTDSVVIEFPYLEYQVRVETGPTVSVTIQEDGDSSAVLETSHEQ